MLALQNLLQFTGESVSTTVDKGVLCLALTNINATFLIDFARKRINDKTSINLDFVQLLFPS